MKRRELLRSSATLGVMAALPGALAACARAADGAREAKAATKPQVPPPTLAPPLTPPPQGSIPVAFLISEGAVVIDFCGPWEVFQDVNIPGRADAPFQLYTVAETRKPIHTSGGMTVVPDYTFEDVPTPKVIVIPAQSAPSDATLGWVRKASHAADVTMSVCTGAFLLAETGLLDGKAATTHHAGYKGLALQYPKIQVKRGARFVEEGNIATAGGLSSGIDLALRVVERYFGREAAKTTAYQMEYQGQGWTDPNSNEAYAALPNPSGPTCPVCEMEIDPETSPSSAYKSKTYYFCSASHKALFDATPEKFTAAAP